MSSTMGPKSGKPIKVSLKAAAPSLLAEINRSLLNDANARRRFEADPVAFLSQHGIEADRSLFPKGFKLPTPQEIQKAGATGSRAISITAVVALQSDLR